MNTKNLKIQVTKEHYNPSCYLNLKRWNSYWHQIKEIIDSNLKDVLVIGVGDNIVVDILKKYDISVETFDFDVNLNPTYVANVVQIKKTLQGKIFDGILCCQVLEHLPFNHFENIIIQLKECINKKLILSLPFGGHKLEFLLSLPKIKITKKNICINRVFKECKFNGEHYWELGYKNYSIKRISSLLAKYFKIEKVYNPINNIAHVFFILTKEP